MTQKVNYKPIHPDELTLAGETFEHRINFEALDVNGNVKTFPNDVCIYVPAQLRKKDDKEVGLKHNVLVFFTANIAITDTTLNDTLTHGLRAAAEASNQVLISLPSPGDHSDVPTDRPDFTVIRDKDISACFAAVKLKGSPGQVRLASHSRGHRGMTRTLMGNNIIGDKNPKERDPATATINTSFVDIRNIKRLVYLDDFFGSAERIMGRLITRGLSNQVLKVYHFTDGIGIRDKSIVNNMKSQFIDLAKIIKQNQGAAIGCNRFILAAISIAAALDNKNTKLAEKVLGNVALTTIIFLKQVPVRATFSTIKPLAANKQDIGDFSKTISFSVSEKNTLLNFLNKEKLLRTNFPFDTTIAAHHFFVCEYAHEFFL